MDYLILPAIVAGVFYLYWPSSPTPKIDVDPLIYRGSQKDCPITLVNDKNKQVIFSEYLTRVDTLLYTNVTLCAICLRNKVIDMYKKLPNGAPNKILFIHLGNKILVEIQSGFPNEEVWIVQLD